MNWLQPSALQRMGSWAQVRLRSHWIEILAIPILASIMEAQPIYVVLLFFTPFFTEDNIGTPFINELSIILLALGLRWWAMGIHAVAVHMGNSLSGQNEQLLRVLGLLLAGGIVIGTPILLVRSVFALILASVLILWFWWRGMQSVRLDDEQLLMYFRLGFIALVCVILFTVFYLDSSYTIIFAVLARDVPIFFLSGLLGLSFTRIALVRQEIAHYSSSSEVSATRNWLIVLIVFWVAVVLAVLGLEIFSFGAVVIIVSDLYYITVAVIQFILFLLAYILTPILYLLNLFLAYFLSLFQFGKPIVPPKYPSLGNRPIGQGLPPEALAAARFVLLLIVLIALYFIVRVILRRLPKGRQEDEVEEIREGLSLHSILQQRRNDNQGQGSSRGSELEALEPDSARSYYRELLQTVANTNPAFARRPDETPSEYQKRLLALVQQTLSDTVQAQDMPSEQEILDVLTRDYRVERYGGKSLEAGQRSYLRSWVPQLIARVTRDEPR